MTEAQRKFRLQVIIAFALVYVLWGSTYLGIRIAVEHIPPALMGALRFLTAGALMLAFCAATGRSVRVSWAQVKQLTIIGVLLLSTGNVVLGWAETYIPTGLAALLIAITPLWFLLLETFSHHGDHISKRGIAGLALGIVGVVVLMWPKLAMGGAVGKRELFGAMLVMFSSFSWATGSVLSKRWNTQVDPYVASGWEMLIAGAVNMAAAVVLGDLHQVVWARSSLLAVLYLVIAGSWIGFTAYVWLLRNVPTPKVATYAYVNPIVAVFLGWLVLHEKIDRYIVAGAMIVVISVVLITRAKIRTKPATNLAEELPVCETT
jgi:drug/metabolite transporter (DMT)-like permease